MHRVLAGYVERQMIAASRHFVMFDQPAGFDAALFATISPSNA
jgi:hypothetical protein